MTHKTYFQEPTRAQIMKYISVRNFSRDLVSNILSLGENEAGIIEARLIPEEFKNSRKFMKQEQDVKIQRFYSLEAMVNNRKTPVQLREIAFNKIKPQSYSCYSFKPFTGNDTRTRRVSLVECLEGIHLYCYASQPGTGFNKPSIEIKPYHDAKRVEKDGAEIKVKVSSRTKKQPKYEFKFSSVPVIDSREKWTIAYNILTDHNCGSKRFNIRYTFLTDKESSRVFNFCSHEIAAYLAIVDYYKNKEKNIIPLQMSQFAIPTQEAVDFYVKLCNNCLIKAPKSKLPRKLNRAEKEILLWGLVYKLGHDRTFYATEKVRDYKW